MSKPPSNKIAAIYIGNLSYNSTEQTLCDHLTFLGLEVSSVRIILDRETGAPRGFAFADIVGDLPPSLECIDGTRLDGRVLRASAAQRREG